MLSLTILNYIRKYWQLIVFGILIAVILSMGGYIYILTNDLKSEVLKHNLTKQELAIEQSNNKVLRAAIDLQATINNAAGNQAKENIEINKKELELQEQRNELMSEKTIPIEEKKTQIRVVTNATRTRGVGLVNSLLE